jgi:hypothetical protein
MVSERRKIGLVKRKCFFLMGWPLKLPKSIQNRSFACQPKYDRLRCEDRGPLRGVSIGRPQHVTPAPGPFLCVLFWKVSNGDHRLWNQESMLVRSSPLIGSYR